MNTSGARIISERAGIAAVLLLAMPGFLLAGAAPSLDGDWQGRLTVDANNSLNVRFHFSRGSNGAYTAVLSSPDNPAVNDTPVSGVSWDGANLKLSVPALQGSYTGKLVGGRIAGEWTQPGGKLPLELAPYQKAVLSADAMKPYVGSWNGVLDLAGQKQTLVFEFRLGAGGSLEGTFSIPDQGMTQPMADLNLENGELSFNALGGRISYKGRLAVNRLAGKLKVPSPVSPPDGVDLALQKGAYKPDPVVLTMAADAFAKLKGRWTGTVSVTNPQSGQMVELPIVVRFETDAQGQQLGYLDSPAQGVNGMIVTAATLDGDRFTVRVGAINAEYAGTLAGSRITGQWNQGGQRLPLQLDRAP